MNYIELNCKITPNNQANINIVVAYLDKLNFESYMETETGVKAYIVENKFNNNDVLKISEKPAKFKLQFSHKIIIDQNWNETWEKNYFKPVLIKDKLLIRASFHDEYPKAELEIIIDPKTAFGTGYHATTYMLLEEILKLDLQKKSVLDMGTGTGILSILSKKLGASYTFAVDNDTKACINTRENIKKNNTPDIDIKTGDINILSNENFDVIYENIWKNTVIADISVLYRHLNKGGILLTSGFYKKDAEDVKNAGIKAGFKHLYYVEKDGWAVVKFTK